MPFADLSDRTKKIIIWTSLGLLIAGAVVAVVLVILKSSKSSNTQSVITVNLTAPGNKTSSTNFNYAKADLKYAKIPEFIGSVLTKSKLINLKITDVFWNSMVINSKSVDIKGGQISDVMNKKALVDLIGAIPDKIRFDGNYKQACYPSEKPTCGDVCRGQSATCTDAGWKCVDNLVCPKGSDLYNCCANDPSGPYATCSSGVISCGQCPEPKIDCGDPGCKGIGPVCTATGWVCAEFSVCPTGDSLKSCCPDKSKPYGMCKLDAGVATITCSSCISDDKTPPCPADCDLSGLVCGSDGKYTCQKGVQCPPASILKGCCGSDQIATCEEKDGKAVKACKDCSSIPKNTKDPNYDKCQNGSCEGHGWVCTVDGWKCKSNQVDPTKVNPHFDISTCCPVKDGRNTPYFDTTSMCVKCKCPAGTVGCSDPGCGIPQGECQNKCCPAGQPCHKDSNGNCMCCPEEQICVLSSGDIKCCPDNTKCVGGQCLPYCGKDETSGSKVVCTANQSCLEIDNLSPDNAGKLRKEYGGNVRVNGTSGFVCVDNKGCSFGNELAVPSATKNYYPCYAFPDYHDKDQPGPGYCTEKSGNPTGQCFKSYTSSSACNATNDCEWRNVLKYMASNSDPHVQANQIEKEMQVIANSQQGNFCDPDNGTTPFARVVAYPGSKDTSCSWDDCWTRMVQPGVIDVEYDMNTGTCVALQSCNDPNVGMTSGLINKDGDKVANPNTQTLPWNKVGGSSSFPACSADASCPLNDSENIFVCVGDGKNCQPPNKFVQKGQIVPNRYSCNPNDSYKCVLDGKGSSTDLETCKNSALVNCCPPGTIRYNEGCYMYNPPKLWIGHSDGDPDPKCNITLGMGAIGPVQCKLTDPNSPYSTIEDCCYAGQQHRACVEKSKTPIPRGVKYCRGVKTETGHPEWCGGISGAGTWVECDQDGGCLIDNDIGQKESSWYYNSADLYAGVVYCPWPPTN